MISHAISLIEQQSRLSMKYQECHSPVKEKENEEKELRMILGQTLSIKQMLRRTLSFHHIGGSKIIFDDVR